LGAQGDRVFVIPAQAGIQSRWTYLFQSPKPVRMGPATPLDARLRGHDAENAIALVGRTLRRVAANRTDAPNRRAAPPSM